MPEVEVVIPVKMHWKGQNVEELHRDVLLEIIRQQHRELAEAREATNQIIRINDAARAVRSR